MLTQNLSSALTPASFVAHDAERLSALRLKLSSGLSPSALESLLTELTAVESETTLHSSTASCIALIEFNHWAEANQIAALSLQLSPNDERLIALLAFSLASMGDFAQATVVLHRAKERLDERQSQGGWSDLDESHDLHAPLTPLSVLLSTLERLILQEESPAEYAFADRPTLNTGSMLNAHLMQSFPLEPGLIDGGSGEDTIRDFDIKGTLSIIDEIAESEPTMNLDRSRTLVHKSAPVEETKLILWLEMENTDLLSSVLEEGDTQLNAFSHASLEDDSEGFNERAEDHITSILVDIEERERDASSEPALFQDHVSFGTDASYLGREVDTQSLS